MTSPAQGTTCILPLAGSGRRLGLSTPKEMLPLGPGRLAIDAALDLLRPHPQIRLVLVTSAGRDSTVAHIHQVLPEHQIATIAQNPARASSTGAVWSALAWFSAINVVLMPDQVLLNPAGDPIGALLEHLLAGAPSCFLAARESDPTRISADGALQLSPEEPPRVIGYQDRPAPAEALSFNATWFGYGFRAEHAEQILELLHASTTGGHVSADEVRASPLWRAPVVDVGPYLDLGTWPDVFQAWGRVMPGHGGPA